MTHNDDLTKGTIAEITMNTASFLAQYEWRLVEQPEFIEGEKYLRFKAKTDAFGDDHVLNTVGHEFDFIQDHFDIIKGILDAKLDVLKNKYGAAEGLLGHGPGHSTAALWFIIDGFDVIARAILTDDMLCEIGYEALEKALDNYAVLNYHKRLANLKIK